MRFDFEECLAFDCGLCSNCWTFKKSGLTILGFQEIQFPVSLLLLLFIIIFRAVSVQSFLAVILGIIFIKYLPSIEANSQLFSC